MKSLQIPNPNSLPIFIWGVLFLMVVTPNHSLLLQLRPEIPVISTYNPIYRIYNPIYNQLSLINGHNCRIFHGKPSIFMIPLWKSPDVFSPVAAKEGLMSSNNLRDRLNHNAELAQAPRIFGKHGHVQTLAIFFGPRFVCIGLDSPQELYSSFKMSFAYHKPYSYGHGY